MPTPDPIMWDSTTPGQIPTTAAIVAGYVDGLYRWTAADWHRLAASQHVTITVYGAPGARVADCETGDLTAAQVAYWAHNELNAGRRPTIYCNGSTRPDVVAALATQGVFPAAVDWWLADPTGTPHRPVWAVACQYAWHSLGQTGALNVDLSVTDGTWPGTITPVPPVKATGVSIVTCPGGGYWEVAADGGVFAYGGAPFYGSLGGQHLSAPITSADTTPTGKGYYLMGADGAVYAFGDATYHGGFNQ